MEIQSESADGAIDVQESLDRVHHFSERKLRIVGLFCVVVASLAACSSSNNDNSADAPNAPLGSVGNPVPVPDQPNAPDDQVTDPGGPNTPDEPSGPNVPDQPNAPDDQVADPGGSETPDEPSGPNVPDQPDLPDDQVADPGGSDTPDGPSGPNVPDRPNLPDDQVADPGGSDTPDGPSGPNVPDQPDLPDDQVADPGTDLTGDLTNALTTRYESAEDHHAWTCVSDNDGVVLYEFYAPGRGPEANPEQTGVTYGPGNIADGQKFAWEVTSPTALILDMPEVGEQVDWTSISFAVDLGSFTAESSTQGHLQCNTL
ncbi:MAG: hypothetical protein V3U76_09625 [Granulosicoccus sp.]